MIFSHSRAKIQWKYNLLLAIPALLPFYPYAQPALAQNNDQVVTAERVTQDQQKTLADALIQYGNEAGIKLSANSQLLAGKKAPSGSLSGSPENILSQLLAGTGLVYNKQPSGIYVVQEEKQEAVSSSASTFDGNTEDLGEIIVKTSGEEGDGFEILLPDEAGSVILNKKQLEMRTVGNGDVNEVLKTLPNVQYQNQTNRDGGTSPVREIDLRPAEISISGARVDDNNFILDGIEINTAGRNQSNAPTALEDEDVSNRDVIYGLHSQQVFVPDSLLDKVEVMDSNISAEYGHFQGGVVKYSTKDADLEKWTGGIDLNGTNNDLLSYILATRTGTNPYNVKAPEFTKLNGAAHISGPVAEGIGVLAMVSGRYAETDDSLAARFKDPKNVEMNTKTTTVLLKSNIEKDWGNLELQSTNSLYHQYHEFRESLTEPVTEKSIGSSNKFTFDKELDQLLGFEDVKITIDGHYNHSEQSRTEDGNNILVHNIVSWPYTASTDAAECRVDDPADTVHCKKGSNGDLIQSEDNFGFKVKTETRLFGNDLKFGVGARRIIASRERPDEVQEYNLTTIKGFFDAAPLVTDKAFSCADPNDPSCVDNAFFASQRQIFPAYDATVGITSLDSWLEYDLDLGRLDLTLGGRIDYDSYFGNLNFAPRLSSSLELTDWLSVSTSYGRYYSDTNASYALADARPDQINYKRQVVGGVVSNEIGSGGWVPDSPASGSFARYKDANLKTPYNDEISVATRIDEAFLGGQFRLKYIRREGKDQFSSIDVGTDKKMTNLGSSLYQSASVEYAKNWSNLDWGILDAIGFSTQATWAKQDSSRPLTKGVDFTTKNTNGIYYNRTAYSAEDFKFVSGNMDIPLKASATVSATLLEERLNLWATANYTFSYDGVVQAYNGDSPVSPVSCASVAPSGFCDVYVDHTFKPEINVNAGASYKLPAFEFGEAELNFRVENLFNSKGNSFASKERPFKDGRRIWLGMKATF